MDYMTPRHLLPVPLAVPPTPFPHQTYGVMHPSYSSFPIIAILVIGMMITSFFLMGYYIFVIKCCLNWQHRVDNIRRLSLSFQGEEPSTAHSTPSEPRGLEESMIRLIPVIHYKPEEGVREFGDRNTCECVVCLSEFQEGEKLRVIPNCGHVFHIDCIDVWLQNNAHCPLCRRTISLTTQQQVHVDQIIAPRPSPQVQSQNIETLIGVDEGFVVIDLDSEDGSRDQNLQGKQGELPQIDPISLSSQKKVLEQQKKEKNLQKVTSMGDECVDVRVKDERFLVQPMRRSFSVDSSMNNTQFYGAVQQALQQQNRHVHDATTIETWGYSGRIKRSCFSLGNGCRSRSYVLPVYLHP